MARRTASRATVTRASRATVRRTRASRTASRATTTRSRARGSRSLPGRATRVYVSQAVPQQPVPVPQQAVQQQQRFVQEQAIPQNRKPIETVKQLQSQSIKKDCKDLILQLSNYDLKGIEQSCSGRPQGLLHTIDHTNQQLSNVSVHVVDRTAKDELDCFASNSLSVAARATLESQIRKALVPMMEYAYIAPKGRKYYQFLRYLITS